MCFAASPALRAPSPEGEKKRNFSLLPLQFYYCYLFSKMIVLNCTAKCKRMKKIIYLLLLFIAVNKTAAAQTKDELQIRNLMNEQLAAWNGGDVDRFMLTYWQSDSLKFIGKSGITYGWQKTLENYKKGYPDTAAMGKLDFNIVEVKRLSVLYFFVVGKWHLNRSIGDIGGHFTLLFKKIKNKWVIVVDHSS
jgi:ketosteroid isomerase-like protein